MEVNLFELIEDLMKLSQNLKAYYDTAIARELQVNASLKALRRRVSLLEARGDFEKTNPSDRRPN